MAKTKSKKITKTTPEAEPVEEKPTTTPEPETKSTKKTRKKRRYKLHAFQPEAGRSGPKNGGSYVSVSPAGAARKAANRWIVPKNEFGVVKKFHLREVGASGESSVYEFHAKRVKLETPKKYKRGDKVIEVTSKVVIVDKPEATA